MPANGYFLTQLDRLQSSLVKMGEASGVLLGDAVAALMTRDVALARDVIARDHELDQLEDDHEEQTIQIIALNQPVARDLRRLAAFLHTNTSIERVGDLAVNIAGAALRVADRPQLKPFVDIPRNYDLVRQMWDDSLRIFASMDESTAGELRDRDDAVDQMNEENIRLLIQISTEDPRQIYVATNMIGVSKALERVADIAVDICDEVIYARRGELRHSRVATRRL